MTNVMFIRSTREPVLAQVIGHSEHGDAYENAFSVAPAARRLGTLPNLCSFLDSTFVLPGGMGPGFTT